MLPAEAFVPMMALGSLLILAGFLMALLGNARRRGMAGAAMLAAVCLCGGLGAGPVASAQGVSVTTLPPSAANPPTSRSQGASDDRFSFQAWGLADTISNRGTATNLVARTGPAASPTCDGKLCFRAWGVDAADAISPVNSSAPVSFASFGVPGESAVPLPASAASGRVVRNSPMDVAVPSGVTPRGQVLVFWRENCSQCLQEKAWLLSAIRPLGWIVSDAPDADFRLVNTVKDTVMRERYRIDVVPQTVYVDAEGNEVSRFVGFEGPTNVTAALLKIRGGQ